MPQSINLIPQQERVEQQKTALVKASTVLTIILLLIVGGVSAYFHFEAKKYTDEISQTDDEIAQLRGKVEALSSVEISARNLDKKYNVLEALFSSRYRYSVLLLEVASRTPEDVRLTTFDVRGDSINVAGDATSYISVSEFISQLLSDPSTVVIDGVSESTSSLEKEPITEDPLFTSVGLNSVTLDSGNAQVKFSLTINFVPANLQEE
jgi:Tfp pilus assembly protein PilN